MTEQEIFDELFSIFNTSDDDNGVVGAGLVRNGKILCKTVSMLGGIHAEYSLLKNLEEMGISINADDIIYTTVEPCGKRTPGGRGEKMGDCTTNLINAGVKKVIYGAQDPHASAETRHKFELAGVSLEQVKDLEIVKKSIEAFNSTCKNPEDWLPEV
ncbi:MAG: hypothetical protein CEO12_360 [Parcubacteria group bacterium Gr01-1014_46]|nr:MAG: hypothetical protein CEO12_360 [Parcubacteria group bacterium Gr01-1014_46]